MSHLSSREPGVFLIPAAIIGTAVARAVCVITIAAGTVSTFVFWAAAAAGHIRLCERHGHVRRRGFIWRLWQYACEKASVSRQVLC